MCYICVTIIQNIVRAAAVLKIVDGEMIKRPLVMHGGLIKIKFIELIGLLARTRFNPSTRLPYVVRYFTIC